MLDIGGGERTSSDRVSMEGLSFSSPKPPSRAGTDWIEAVGDGGGIPPTPIPPDIVGTSNIGGDTIDGRVLLEIGIGLPVGPVGGVVVLSVDELRTGGPGAPFDTNFLGPPFPPPFVFGGGTFGSAGDGDRNIL